MRSHRHRIAVNVWAEFIDDNLIGPYLLPLRLTGDIYLTFLQDTLPELLEMVPLEVRREMWFKHDGAPAHFTDIVCEYLEKILAKDGLDVEAQLPDPLVLLT
jgi:hypothetical protein